MHILAAETVGEQTGALPELNSVSEFFEEDVATALTASLALIEPSSSSWAWWWSSSSPAHLFAGRGGGGGGGEADATTGHLMPSGSDTTGVDA